MTDKQIINTCEFFNVCKSACGGTLEDTKLCSCYELYKQLKRKEQECKKLKKVSCKFKEYCTCNTEKFLQTLIEIKEIAEEDFNHTCWKTYARQLKQILQLIRESEIKHES